MRVLPQPDGTLWIENPDSHVFYDMGNPHLFVRFGGAGGVIHVLLTEGFYAGSWDFYLTINGRPFRFQEGLAIGRLWKLAGRAQGIEVQLESFIAEERHHVFQSLSLISQSSVSIDAQLRIRLRFSLPVPWRRRRLSDLVRWLPRAMGRAHLWSEGWAKLLLPPTPQRVDLLSGGLIRVDGALALRWISDMPPHMSSVLGKDVHLQWDLRISPGEVLQLRWAMIDESEERPWSSMEVARDSATRYAEWLSQARRMGDPILQSLCVAGLNAAISMFKIFPDGFAGLLAGPDYAYPPRLYFRDGYWTAQVLLPFKPDLVRQHLISLAQGVHENGECPSGVFAPHLLKLNGGLQGGFPDWLPAHIDAPAFLVLLLYDYLRTTEDWSVLRESVFSLHNLKERQLWSVVQSAVNYLIAQDQDGNGLIEKPNAPNDWADNVRRGIWVTYDQALYAAALRAAATVARSLGEEVLSSYWMAKAEAARYALNTVLWDPRRGYYVNYIRPGYKESHFSIDTLLVLLYNLASDEQARSVLAAARCLQTRDNPEQPFGDWGVMSVFPLYGNRRDLFGKSALPYSYHNGADWPYWDGIYGWLLLQREDPDWVYVLTRWWTYGLEKGWLTPVEYYSPPYPPGGMLQGWSSMPAAALIWEKERIYGIRFA